LRFRRRIIAKHPKRLELCTCAQRAWRGTPHALTLPGHPADADVRRRWTRSHLSSSGGRRRADAMGFHGPTPPKTTELSGRLRTRQADPSKTTLRKPSSAATLRQSGATKPRRCCRSRNHNSHSAVHARTRVGERDTTHQCRQIRESRADLRTVCLSTLAPALSSATRVRGDEA
jgi:hypothetical protein